MQRRHDTAAARKTAGVDPTLWHEFSPGQRVMTREGIAGVVERVEDGPGAGNEHYIVTLDRGLGGGQYGAGELRPLGDASSSQRTAAKVATEPHQASDDYPELGTILEDRPPLEYAFKQMGSLVDDDGDLLVLAQTIRAQSNGVADAMTLCSLCFKGSEVPDNAEPVLIFDTDTAHATCVAKAAADIAEVERGITPEDDEDLDRDYSTLDREDSDEVVEQVWSQSALRWKRNDMGEYEAGKWRIVPSSPNTTGFPKGWVLVEAETHQQIEHYPYLGDAKQAAEEREPKEGSKQAAPYGEIPTETGEGFEWGSWYVIEEGNTANIIAGPFSSRAAAEGWVFGNDHTFPERGAVVHENRLEYGRVASKDPVVQDAENLLVTHGYGPDRWSFDWCRFRRNRDCYYPMELDVSGTQQAGYPVWTPYHRGACPRHAWDEQKDCPVAEPGPKSNEPKFYPDATVPWSEGGQRWERFGRFASKDVVDDFTFAFTASWRDVQGKAARIRQEGGVRIISSPTKGSSNEYYIVAEVNGDTNVYQTRLMRQPGKATAVAMWECGCAWGHYAWGRSGRWKRYEGRMCSHALAVLYEAQSQMGFDRSGPLTEQPSEPSWRKDTEPQVKYPAPPIPEWRVGVAKKPGPVTTMDGETHSIEAQATGRDYWAKCSNSNCGWVWLGTYASEKPGKRREEAYEEFERHVYNRDRTITMEQTGEILPTWEERTAIKEGNWRPIDLDQPDEPPIRAVGFLPSKPIVVRYRGRITEVTLEDDGTLTDRRGNPVEPRDLKHPRFHPRMGLDPRDRGDYEPIYKGTSLHSALREGRVQPLPAVEAAADMNGAMVAIKPPQRILSTLRNTGEMSEDFSNLHVTIAYFGDKSGLDVAGLKRAVHAFAADAHQITARISGYAIWKDMQGNRILVATIDSPGIEEWRARLIDHLAGTGISPMRTHGFVPHITMAYGYDKTEVPAAQPRGDFSANSVWIVLGRDWTEVPLGGGSSPYGRAASVVPLETEDHFPFEAAHPSYGLVGNQVVASVDGQTAGWLEYEVDDGGDYVFIAEVQVMPEHQRLGVAKGMLSRLVEAYPGAYFDAADPEGNTAEGNQWLVSVGVPGVLRRVGTTAATYAKTCDFCDQPATKAIVWAEGKAYVPACDDHVQEAKDAIDDPSDIDFVRDIEDGEKVGVIARTSAPPHEFVGMPPAYQICDICDMRRDHPVHDVPVEAHHEAAWDDTDDPDVGYGTFYDDGWADQATDGKPSRMDHLEGTDRSEYAQGVADANGGVLPDSGVWSVWGLPEDGVEAAEDLDLHTTEAELHDEPEPALPRTDGDEEEQPEDDAGTDDERFTSVGSIPGEESRSWLMQEGSEEGDHSTSDIAQRAQQVLATKAFTPEEQAALINEGEDGTTARNIGDLDIAGTHYEALERLEGDDELEVWDLLG